MDEGPAVGTDPGPHRGPDPSSPDDGQDALFDTAELPGPPPPPAGAWIGTGFFGSSSMRRLFSAQVVSSLGDWIGLVALLAVADRLVRGTAFDTFGPGFVLMSRLVPGLFLAPAAGVLVDRLDRRKVMVTCDVGRGIIMMTIPFITQLWVLLFVSLLLEAGQLLWVPAKEASVPNLVHGEYVQRANSLSLAAAYGTFPIGAALFSALARVAALLGGVSFLRSFEINQESLALFVDAGTFFTSAVLVAGLVLPTATGPRPHGPGLRDEWNDLVVGIRFIRSDNLVRTVMGGLGTALLGVGAVVSLGPTFVRELLAGGSAGFGLVLFGLGVGGGVGMLLTNTIGRKIPPMLLFTGSVMLAGASLVLAALMSSLGPGVAFVALLGLFGAPGYSAGFTLMHSHVDDQLRGRVFGALLTVIRICMVCSLALSPIVSGFVDRFVRRLFDGTVVHVGGLSVNIAGVRLSLVFAGVLIAAAGMWAFRRLRLVRPRRRPVSGELVAGVMPEDVFRPPGT